eukprot:3864458-Rhodomonas_salina.1
MPQHPPDANQTKSSPHALFGGAGAVVGASQDPHPKRSASVKPEVLPGAASALSAVLSPPSQICLFLPTQSLAWRPLGCRSEPRLLTLQLAKKQTKALNLAVHSRCAGKRCSKSPG